MQFSTVSEDILETYVNFKQATTTSQILIYWPPVVTSHLIRC